MAVKSKSSLRRTNLVALAIGALSLPAIAQAAPEERGNWRQRVAREDSPRAERSEQVRQAAVLRLPQQLAGDARRGGEEGHRRGWGGQLAEPQAVRTQQETTQAPASWRDRAARSNEERRLRNETWRSRDGQAETWQGRTSEAERVAPQPATRTGTDYRRWNTHWRGRSRYDWYGWRNRYPGYFQVGAYYSPYRNYSYRRLSIGYFLDSLFFGQDYWIADPGYYRLPEAYGPYRWVRYYDDAVLVNIYDGEVADVIYNFFW